ncbi:zinc finger protein 423-like [Aphis gossypii]|uniref:zinc finger protein 423-like n=1 Tax=Aphis gossypii TaxID=80765 RepID=UPI0021599620|nr:zinc finger protein 423-like [Aphis gossypii]
MHKCQQCASVFKLKKSLDRHEKLHTGILYRCTVCAKTFKDESNLRRHLKKVHAILHAPATLSPQRESVIKYAPRINRPAVPTDSSNIMSDDDICMAAMANFEQEQEDREYCIEIAPQIFVPDIQAGCSNIMSDDDICMAAMENFEKEVQNVNKDSYTTGVNGKRVSTSNTSSAVRSKKSV